jgi:hypothetical protein
MCWPTESISAINLACSVANCSATVSRYSGSSLPFGSVVRNSAEAAVLLAHHGGGAAQVDDFGAPQTVAHQGGGDAHAVEHIPDIVQHARGHVGHAGLSGSVHQLPVELVELLGIQLVLVMSWKMPRMATGRPFSTSTVPLSRIQTVRPSAATIRYS